ncbi:uncharacterized protein LOC105795840 [Gossypium raimondii]|uniref:DUF4283 domain-containing protein n=1 Tax=Gossypium raimondii TaxID=29730 RepID=A0A7J8P9Q1_GOSRA|nr:uncharacterized protein LOC105795840 [Gossypium raimondii]MBA0585918.1 hypothetical protein [Gossypium raimondii]
MSGEKVNREAMYRVLKSLWFTKEEVNFVALNDGTILVKFGNIEDRTRMLNLTPWLFDQSLFPLFPFVKGQEMDDYEFNIMPFWIRIYNIPFEQMDREVAIDVGKAIGEVVAIDCHDKNGRWTEYIRIRVKIDVLRPLRRVVHLVGSEGTETVCTIKYERLPAFCYICGLIGDTTQKCNRKEEHLETNNLNFQYGSWLRPQLGGPTQARCNRRNGIAILEKKINPREETNGNKEGM